MQERSAEHVRARRLAALRRRLAHLEARLAANSGHGSYDRAEAAALRWAIEQLERHP